MTTPKAPPVQLCSVADCLAISSWVGAGINETDAMWLLFPEEAARMTMLNLFPGSRYPNFATKEKVECP